MLFVGREDLMRRLWATLSERSSVLVGPRRVGKSTLLDEMSTRPQHGFRLEVINLQGCTTVEGAVERMQRALEPEGAASRLARRVEEVQVVDTVVKLAPTQALEPWTALESLLERLVDGLEDDDTLVIALDELPWWLDELERRETGRARTALAQLRYLALDRRFHSLRWVFTGSVGLAGRAVAWHSSAELNHLDLVVVPPLDPAASAALFEAEVVAGGKQITPGAARRAHQIAGGLPHWVKVLAARCASADRVPVDAQAVQLQVERLLGTQMRHLFQEEGEGHLMRRFTDSDRRFAAAILTALSEADRPLPRQGLLTSAMAVGASSGQAREVLLRLVDDFYLVETDAEHLAFLVPLFGLWWQRWGRP